MLFTANMCSLFIASRLYHTPASVRNTLRLTTHLRRVCVSCAYRTSSYTENAFIYANRTVNIALLRALTQATLYPVFNHSQTNNSGKHPRLTARQCTHAQGIRRKALARKLHSFAHSSNHEDQEKTDGSRERYDASCVHVSTAQITRRARWRNVPAER